jgi:hypothetical protein
MMYVNPRGLGYLNTPKRKKAKSKMANKKKKSRRKPKTARRRTITVTRTKRGLTTRVRRNAGITSFIQPNPMIMDNPRRRRRRRRNPGLGGLATLSVNSVMKKTITFGGGAAVGAGVNILAIRRIQNMWLRNGARIAAAVVGAAMMPGEFGAAYAGSTLYPLMAELALMTKLVAPAATEADLMEVAADLEDALDDMDNDDGLF